ncbi:MAG: hypothetical protein HUK02_04405 [Bacteroidaceae bacterium]|nr:hypothetical protein [Bacteroidaceae bacterium]
MKHVTFLLLMLAISLSATAETVLLEEDFDTNYSKSFAYVIDHDALDPNQSIISLFTSAATGNAQPWWVLRETKGASDAFMGSHSWYTQPGKSDDWLISVPVIIPSTGFELSFDAQSAIIRKNGKLSDLSLFILEEKPDPTNLPTTPTKVWEQVPAGDTPDVTTDEWTRYTYSLDAYAGKTIFICFVNQNYDCDLLCIDRVKVASKVDPVLPFTPTKRMLIEEGTGSWCGNCPIGIYNIESLLDDPELGDKVIPVSIHVAGSPTDWMELESYEAYMNFNGVPKASIDRQTPVGFSGLYDANYQPSDPNSFAHKVQLAQQKFAYGDLTVEGQWVISGSDTTAIDCKATFRPALALTNVDYKVGFILTENNVHLDGSPYWVQHNYFAEGGQSHLNAPMGGWSTAKPYVMNMRFHDVARAISHLEGAKKSLPADMAACENYTFSYCLDIPDKEYKHNGELVSTAICREQCMLTAFVLDAASGLIVNAARTPLSEKATQRATLSDIISAITTPATQQTDQILYDLQGRRITAPAKGVYIKGRKKVVK